MALSIPSLWRVAGRTTIRLSQYNRFHATIRHPKYLQDYKCTITPDGSVKDRRSYERVLRKWKLPFLVDPEEVKEWWWLKEAYQDAEFFSGPVKVIRHAQTKHYMVKGRERKAIKEEEVLARKSSSKKEVSRKKVEWKHYGDWTPHLKEGRYLTLQVDLTATLKELIEKGQSFVKLYSKYVTKKVKKGQVFTPELKRVKYLKLTLDLASERDQIRRFKKLILQALPYVKRPTTRHRETELDPWGIYDLHTMEVLSFTEITKGKFHDFESKLLDEEMYKKVQYAYQKAVKMIKAVTPKAT